MKNLYQAHLMDHYHHPRHRGQVASPHFALRYSNPLCGDLLYLTGSVKNGVIEAIAFEGSGCVISQAASSMLMEYSQGKRLDEMRRLEESAIIKLLGVEIGPVRRKCALLALHALQEVRIE